MKVAESVLDLTIYSLVRVHLIAIEGPKTMQILAYFGLMIIIVLIATSTPSFYFKWTLGVIISSMKGPLIIFSYKES